jgi:hypothetical protein
VARAIVERARESRMVAGKAAIQFQPAVELTVGGIREKGQRLVAVAGEHHVIKSLAATIGPYRHFPSAAANHPHGAVAMHADFPAHA